ncbi:hypothetical protein EDD15DRAFT_2393144 [Pisolithus albus]|nr:hypothetical protein EDD15DRAFT_2393144 [Pisolithus albus]
MSLPALPYDLLFHIAQYLDVDDIHSLQATCKSLRSFTLTRPVYRSLAYALLCRSRPLPLPAFRRLADISTDNLIRAVDRAHTFEKAWRVRAPRPARSSPLLATPDSCFGAGQHQHRWYIKISAPPNEEIDWLSPITASYTLCATKSGRVVCWDVARDVCLAEWDPRSLMSQLRRMPESSTHTNSHGGIGAHAAATNDKKWELWKCRVEFDERATAIAKPTFLPLTSFYTTGVVMNVFLLDPPRRLLSAFVWLASSNTIGLYVLLDWDEDEYIYVDTGVGCLISSNWSCILHNDQIVIHSEEADAAYQHFYPLNALRGYSRPRNGALKLSISARLPPIKSVSKKFVFPRAGVTSGAGRDVPSSTSTTAEAFSLLDVQPVAGPSSSAGSPIDDCSVGDPVDEDAGTGSTEPSRESRIKGKRKERVVEGDTSPEPAPNPYPFPPWYPESAHFVRQWWPTLPGVPRLSCTVVLLAAHDPETHRTRFVLAQHYFKVPITRSIDVNKLNSSSSADEDDRDEDDEMLHLWYVSTPFEVVCVLDSPADNGEEEDAGDRPRPLVAVDFGHAVWVEYAAEPGGVYGVDASRLVGDVAQFTDSEEEDGVEGSGEEGSSDLFEGVGAAPVSQGVQTSIDLHTGDGTIFDTRRHRVPKCLRFVTFPPVHMANERRHGKGRAHNGGGRTREEAIVRTLEIPEELDLDGVETINIDQSQGAVILSVKEGKIFILRYE